MPCGVFENSQKYFNEIFKSSDSRKFRPTKFKRYTVSHAFAVAGHAHSCSKAALTTSDMVNLNIMVLCCFPPHPSLMDWLFPNLRTYIDHSSNFGGSSTRAGGVAIPLLGPRTPLEMDPVCLGERRGGRHMQCHACVTQAPDGTTQLVTNYIWIPKVI